MLTVGLRWAAAAGQRAAVNWALLAAGGRVGRAVGGVPTGGSARGPPNRRGDEEVRSRTNSSARHSADAAQWTADAEAAAAAAPAVHAVPVLPAPVPGPAPVLGPGRPGVGDHCRSRETTAPRDAARRDARASANLAGSVRRGGGRQSSRLQTTCSGVVGSRRRRVDARNGLRDRRVLGARAPQHNDDGHQQEQQDRTDGGKKFLAHCSRLPGETGRRQPVPSAGPRTSAHREQRRRDVGRTWLYGQCE